MSDRPGYTRSFAILPLKDRYPLESRPSQRRLRKFPTPWHCSQSQLNCMPLFESLDHKRFFTLIGSFTVTSKKFLLLYCRGRHS